MKWMGWCTFFSYFSNSPEGLTTDLHGDGERERDASSWCFMMFMAIMLVVQLAQPPRNYQQHRVAILWKQHQLAAGSPGESHLRLGDTKKREIWGTVPPGFGASSWFPLWILRGIPYGIHTLFSDAPSLISPHVQSSLGGWCWQAVTSAISWYNPHDMRVYYVVAFIPMIDADKKSPSIPHHVSWSPRSALNFFRDAVRDGLRRRERPGAVGKLLGIILPPFFRSVVISMGTSWSGWVSYFWSF